MRAALGFLSLVCVGGVALAQLPAPSGAAPAPHVQATAGTPAVIKKDKRRARTPQVAAKSAQPAATAPDALSSCIELWEPATHMTRRQWTHACRRVADRLVNATLR